MIFIDLLDDIYGREALTEEIWYVLRKSRWCYEEERLIICSFENESCAEEFHMVTGYPIIYMDHVKPNKRIIRDCERKLGIKINGKYGSLDKIENMMQLRNIFNAELMQAIVNQYL